VSWGETILVDRMSFDERGKQKHSGRFKTYAYAINKGNKVVPVLN
jgi:hypothetical protein